MVAVEAADCQWRAVEDRGTTRKAETLPSLFGKSEQGNPKCKNMRAFFRFICTYSIPPACTSSLLCELHLFPLSADAAVRHIVTFADNRSRSEE